MLHKPLRSVLLPCVLIFMPYFKKTIKKVFFFIEHLFFCKKKKRDKKNQFFLISCFGFLDQLDFVFNPKSLMLCINGLVSMSSTN